MINKTTNDIEKFLITPRDSTKMNDEQFSSTLCLSFIGYCARPSNIPKELLEKCVSAFNNNRGKMEWEIEAVKKVISEWRIHHAPETETKEIEPKDR